MGVILSWGRGLNGGRGQKDGRGQTHPHVKFELALGEGCLKVQVFAGPANFGGTTLTFLGILARAGTFPRGPVTSPRERPKAKKS